MNASTLHAAPQLARHSLGRVPLGPQRLPTNGRQTNVPRLSARALLSGNGGNFNSNRGSGLSGVGRNNQGGQPGGGGLIGLDGGSGSTGETGGLYLPFMKPADTSSAAPGASMNEQLAILRDRRGYWHEYASVIASLTRQGVSPAVIAESTGMTGVEQNVVTTAAQVYATLRQVNMEAELMAYYDNGGAEILYELRILAGAQRKDAAEYVAREGMDGKGARELARAIKMHERRGRESDRASFSTAPGDCLAYSFYRSAQETRSRADKESFLLRASKTAATKPAREYLNTVLSQCRDPAAAAAAAAPAAAARLTVARLRADETQARPVPVVTSLAELESLPTLPDLEGPFRLMSPTPGLRWATVPSWPVIRNCISLIAVLFPTAEALPTLRGRSVDGPSLVLVAPGVGAKGVVSEHYYVVRDAAGGGSVGMTVLPGVEVRETWGEMTKEVVVGRVVLGLLQPDPNADVEDIDVDDWE